MSAFRNFLVYIIKKKTLLKITLLVFELFTNLHSNSIGKSGPKKLNTRNSMK